MGLFDWYKKIQGVEGTTTWSITRYMTFRDRNPHLHQMDLFKQVLAKRFVETSIKNGKRFSDALDSIDENTKFEDVVFKVMYIDEREEGSIVGPYPSAVVEKIQSIMIKNGYKLTPRGKRTEEL